MRESLASRRSIMDLQASPVSVEFSHDSDHFIKMYGNLFQAIGDTCHKLSLKSKELAYLQMQA
jgi:hypothetical protein